MRLDVDGVRKSYPLPGGADFLTALDGIDLTFESGKPCILQGVSGSGKTTLFSIIAGLAQPDSGRVLYDGRVERPSAGEISCGFQEALLVPELTVLENLSLPAICSKTSMPYDRGEQLLEEFGLAEMFDLLPAALSGGEKRRLTLARSLSIPARLLLLDEPTAYLDEEWSITVMELIKRETVNRGSTLLLATHNPLPGFAEARVIRLERGMVIDNGNY